MKNAAKFKELMLLLCEIHSRAISDALMDTYWALLGPFSDEEAVSVLTRVIREGTFFPKPGEITTLLEGSRKDRGLLSWVSVVGALKSRSPWDSIQFEDATVNDVVEFMGGWPAICLWSNDDLKWKEKEFVDLYAIMAGRSKVPYLKGLHELEGGQHGSPILIPMEGKKPRLLEQKGVQHDGKE